MINKPDIWIKKFPRPKESDHKYSRGQVVVLGGKDMTGAACLSADGAARVGAGLVTIISSNKESAAIYKNFRPYIIVKNNIDIDSFVVKAKSKSRICLVIGPGLGNKDYQMLRSTILSLLDEGVPIVIDADGLNAFAGQADLLFSNIHKDIVLTPHDGEFKKLFPDLAQLLGKNRAMAAQKAAELSGAVIVLKGHKTIIAAQGREAVVNYNACAYLATAGSGDVLSGAISGLIAQGMSAFDAACAGVYMHGRASEIFGAGLVASDLIEIFPKVLKEMLGIHKKLG